MIKRLIRRLPQVIFSVKVSLKQYTAVLAIVLLCILTLCCYFMLVYLFTKDLITPIHQTTIELPLPDDEVYDPLDADFD